MRNCSTDGGSASGVHGIEHCNAHLSSDLEKYSDPDFFCCSFHKSKNTLANIKFDFSKQRKQNYGILKNIDMRAN